MPKIAVIGAGGHARSSINLLINYLGNKSNIYIYDDSFANNIETINLIPLIGGINDIKSNQDVFLSIGNNNLRKKYFFKFKDQIIKSNIIHDKSLQENDVKV